MWIFKIEGILGSFILFAFPIIEKSLTKLGTHKITGTEHSNQETFKIWFRFLKITIRIYAKDAVTSELHGLAVILEGGIYHLFNQIIERISMTSNHACLFEAYNCDFRDFRRRSRHRLSVERKPK